RPSRQGAVPRRRRRRGRGRPARRPGRHRHADRRARPGRARRGGMMTANETTVSAPGKVILIGEYAVLHGHPAVVAAVDRRVTGRFVPGGAPATALVKHVVETVRAYLLEDGGTPPDGAPELDSRALSSEAGKLGLGSSAAVAAAGVGAMLEASGCDLEYTLRL